MNEIKEQNSVGSNESNIRPFCPTCAEKVEGRSDKIFCGIPCKNKHHSIARAQFKSRAEYAFDRIKRNWILLEGILGKDHNHLRIHRDALFKHGFDISRCTRAFQNGRTFIFEIGEYQCKLFENGIVEVKRILALSPWIPGFFERWLVDFPAEWKVGKTESGECKTITNNDLGRFNE